MFRRAATGAVRLLSTSLFRFERDCSGQREEILKAMRSYELMFVVEPRTSEEDAKALANEFKNQVEATGAQVVKKEHMGRRKLAYEIQKLKEGRYFLFYILSEDGNGFAGVEARMEQHDQILRYLVIRTDEDLQRAGLPLPEPGDDEDLESDSEDEEESSAEDEDEDEDDEDEDDDEDDEDEED